MDANGQNATCVQVQRVMSTIHTESLEQPTELPVCLLSSNLNIVKKKKKDSRRLRVL